MSKKTERVEELRSTMWYNAATGIHTYGACMNGCGKTARGAGLCFDCAAKELGELVGKSLAKIYAKLIKEVKAAESLMDDKAHGAPEED